MNKTRPILTIKYKHNFNLGSILLKLILLFTPVLTTFPNTIFLLSKPQFLQKRVCLGKGLYTQVLYTFRVPQLTFIKFHKNFIKFRNTQKLNPSLYNPFAKRTLIKGAFEKPQNQKLKTGMTSKKMRSDV